MLACLIGGGRQRGQNVHPSLPRRPRSLLRRSAGVVVLLAPSCAQQQQQSAVSSQQEGEVEREREETHTHTHIQPMRPYLEWPARPPPPP